MKEKESPTEQTTIGNTGSHHEETFIKQPLNVRYLIYETEDTRVVAILRRVE